jgi:hypothetical protein
VPLAAWILATVAGAILLALYALPWAWIAFRVARIMHVRQSRPDREMAKLSAELTKIREKNGLDVHEP